MNWLIIIISIFSSGSNAAQNNKIKPLEDGEERIFMQGEIDYKDLGKSPSEVYQCLISEVFSGNDFTTDSAQNHNSGIAIYSIKYINLPEDTYTSNSKFSKFKYQISILITNEKLLYKYHNCVFIYPNNQQSYSTAKKVAFPFNRNWEGNIVKYFSKRAFEKIINDLETAFFSKISFIKMSCLQ